jgi:hypothetical protein
VDDPGDLGGTETSICGVVHHCRTMPGTAAATRIPSPLTHVSRGPEVVTAMVEHSADAAGPGTPTPGPAHRQVFEVRVTGSVEEDVLRQLSDVEVRSQELRTSLRGVFVDQAELHGFLARLRAFGLDVVEVHRLPDGVAESAVVSTEAEREP